MPLDAYLLTRQWRDTRDGIELSFWASSAKGPINVIIPQQQAVCFIEQGISCPLPPGTTRKSLALKRLYGSRVDGLYFSQQRQLQQLRASDLPLCESDVKPADRYLMERFITAPLVIHGELTQGEHYLKGYSVNIKPGNYSPTLKMVSVDIETRGHSTELYSIAVATLESEQEPSQSCVVAKPASIQAEVLATQVVFMVGDDEPANRPGFQLIYCANEKDLLVAFFQWIEMHDPDVIAGWAVVNFDLRFIDRKCRSLGIAFRMGRGGENAAVLEPGNPGSPRIARVPGRVVFDGIDLLKAGFWSFESFSLDHVAHKLLGVGKLITSEQDKVKEINHLFKHDKPALADYNHRDCTLVNEIFIKADLLQFAIQKANLTGLSLDRLGGSVAAFDNLYLPRLHRRGFVAPDVKQDANAPGSPGGYVMDSVPGLYKNVLVLDFKSLYPSIIRTFHIDPLGLAEPGDDPIPGFVDAEFSRVNPILPELIKSLWAARDQAKLTQNAPLSQAIKIIMNSFYGVLGSSGCRFYSQQLASSITRRGHEIITQSRDWIEQQGYSVIYGDTDSVFVLIGDRVDPSECRRIGEQLMQALNIWWSDQLHKRYRITSYLEVEYETHYLRFFMPTVRGMSTGSKKRYAGLVFRGEDVQPDLVVKGLEAARTDWTPLARDFQRALFLRVFSDQPVDVFIREITTQLHEGKLDEQLVYTKRIRRPLEDYIKNVPPHIQAARKLPYAGRSIRYVMTRQGPEPVDAMVSPPDYQHYLDKQLAPAADGILQFIDTSFAAINDAQLQMF